ncbi:hypothetical protein LY632_00830 [Erythrobacter sp. SDW2]|uniref:hypothetical protein n=1 Tax=Erythrobacter sp. SDW2 TaxID=2907154 RepID=UPI001F2C406E|nr:hypothetical protein [Erythrobacter sp. SDW2]UIP06977.1 hypothetical protein LY632_00830 [Erythrobacter sp. SDW2]
MTDDKRELELDFEPKAEGKASSWELLVPIHADNFALALASGYLGGSLKSDAARDLQSYAANGLFAFIGEVPAWAISEGEDGDRVLLSLAGEGEAAPGPGTMELLGGPERITTVRSAYFRDEASLANFNASYDAFPDVPMNIVELAAKWPVCESGERPTDLQELPVEQPSRRSDLDFLGGFAAGIIDLLAENTFDEAICHFLKEPGTDLAENGRRLLLALEPRTSQVDVSIWTATIEALRSRFGKRGFDRREFLADVEGRLADHGPEAESWVRGCQKVIDAEIDIPSLADSEKIGRRAALAIILSHEPSGLEELESNLETGPRVRALVTAAVYAFAGLSRIDSRLKSPAPRMEAVLELGDRIATGKPVRVEIETSKTGADLTRHQVIKVGGNSVLERQVEPPAYMVMLKARIQEAGYKVELDGASGQIGIRPGSAKGEFIMVEDCSRSSPGNPIVNLVLPIATLGARPTVASLKKLMSAAWENATTVALREVGDSEEVVAMASLPLATLDRDELNFHVERLLKVSTELGGKKRKGRRVKN